MSICTTETLPTPFKKILNVKTNTATINNLEHTTQYWFGDPYITKDGKTYEGEATMKKTATQAGLGSGSGHGAFLQRHSV